MKDVLITIKSTQDMDGAESGGTELITSGTYSYAPGRILFSYMESELTGLEGTRTDFTVRPDEVVLSRAGAVNSKMVFRQGKKQRFLYNTKYGGVTLGLNTRRLDCSLDEHGGDMEIEYELAYEQSFLTRNKFKINVREKEMKS